MDIPPLPISAAARLPKATVYKKQVKKLLENKFSSISCAAISAVLKHVDFHYPDADRILNRIEANGLANEDADDARVKVQAVFPTMPKIKVFLKNDRAHKRFRVTNPLLLQEICSALDGTANDDDSKENKSPATIVKDDQTTFSKGPEELFESEENNGLVECGCCYGDYPPQDMKECTANEGHQVCKDCICRYVSEQLDGNNNINFQCIIDENCRQPYHHISVLEEVLSPDLKRRTNDAIYRSVVQQAGVDGLWTCGKCNYMGFLVTPTKRVFCPPCAMHYCTKCHRPDHGERTCKQMQADEDRAKDPINMAHEKMSEAVTRRCPKCLTPFIKHDGCNKMTCRVKDCKTLSCYICGLEVQDYSHFCNHKHPNENVPCRCGKTCELFTSTEQMDRRDRIARGEAGRKVLQEAGFSPDRINDILQSPDAKKEIDRPDTPQIGVNRRYDNAQVDHVLPAAAQVAAAANENNVACGCTIL